MSSSASKGSSPRTSGIYSDRPSNFSTESASSPSQNTSSDLSLQPKNPFHNQSPAIWRYYPGTQSRGISQEPFSTENTITGFQRPLERASHSKSRSGCFNCKRRRIKCDEKRPTCSGCTKRRLDCQWPDVQFRKTRAAAQRRSSTVPMQMSSSNGNFTILDFRLFYHFMQKAYPHHPIGNDWVWTHEVPSISHNYDYLMHGILALAASDITAETPENADLACSAMAHRVKSIKLFNGALSKGIKSLEEGNAMLATCYALLWQSFHVEDGLPEFLSFTRGCGIVAKTMGITGFKYIFQNLVPDDDSPHEKMIPFLDGPPAIDPDAVDAALKSLEAFSHMCHQPYEKHFHGLLVETAAACHSSSYNAYMGLKKIYEAFIAKMGHRDFQDFTTAMNPVGQLLQSHFIGIQLLMSPITDNELGGRKVNSPGKETARWLGPIHRNIPTHLRKYNIWPISFAKVIQLNSYLRETGGHSEQLEATLQKLEPMVGSSS